MEKEKIELSSKTSELLINLNRDMERINNLFQAVCQTVINEAGVEGNYKISPDFKSLVLSK